MFITWRALVVCNIFESVIESIEILDLQYEWLRKQLRCTEKYLKVPQFLIPAL